MAVIFQWYHQNPAEGVRIYQHVDISTLEMHYPSSIPLSFRPQSIANGNREPRVRLCFWISDPQSPQCGNELNIQVGSGGKENSFTCHEWAHKSMRMCSFNRNSKASPSVNIAARKSKRLKTLPFLEWSFEQDCRQWEWFFYWNHNTCDHQWQIWSLLWMLKL
jgi:hypothetical protein